MLVLSSAPFFNLGSVENLVGFILAIVILAACNAVFYALLRNKLFLISAIVFEVLMLLGWGFNLYPVFVISGVVVAVIIIVTMVVQSNRIRTLYTNFVEKGIKLRKNKINPEALFDREEVYGKVANAVISLSKQKKGALITFEKKDKLDLYVKSGTILNAPIVPELLETIFYTGTRLHDGAVIIRDDAIYAASVYFVPTTKPLTGKYGSRHRAAIGISETTDSVTIIVSEETGRIAIAYDGELQPVGPDTLLGTFMDYMAMEKKEEAKEEKKGE